MKPEFVAHQGQPHANVAMRRVPRRSRGAGSFAEGEAVRHPPADRGRLRNTIRGRSSRQRTSSCRRAETCERCHWPRGVPRRRIRRVVEYADDEKNTESVTTLRVHVGGGDTRQRKRHGHPLAHEPRQRDRVRRDRQGTAGDSIRAADRWTGSRARVRRPGILAASRSRRMPLRRMDCTDCHNRPSHAIDATAGDSGERAMTRARFRPRCRSSTGRR